MQFFTRFSPLVVSTLALSVTVYLAFWGLSAPTASATEGEFAYWKDSGSTDVCDFLEEPGNPQSIDYVCADWFTEEGTELTCCIDGNNLGSEDPTACQTIISMPSTTERPGL